MTENYLTNPWFIALLTLGALFWLWLAVVTRRQPSGPGLAQAARQMATPRQMRALGERAAMRTAKRLGAPTPGLTIGRAIRGGRWLYQDREACSVDVAGPRTGKTTSRVVPAVLSAPGAVLATSNKRDVLDVTRGPRSEVGPVTVFDPQGVAGEPPSFWWNPLGAVTSEIAAAQLADVFVAAVTSPDARTDAFFAGKGRRLVTALLLAAALDRRTIDVAHHWITDTTAARDAVDVLRDHGHERLAASLDAELRNPSPKTQAGVFAEAERVLAFLTNAEALRWVTPGLGRAEFRPAEFVAGKGTLYLLSREGAGSAAALVAALTVAVTSAAEELAKRSPGGRLGVPLVCALDEAANVCRWPELPALFSHYGSRGIALLVWLQSYSQGVTVWGREGMRTLWGAATVTLYGGGVAEPDFLEDLSRMVGEYDRPMVSTSSARGGRTTTRNTQRARILPVDALKALPRGRAVVLAPGTPAALVRTVPWMSGPHAGRIRAHLDRAAA